MSETNLPAVVPNEKESEFLAVCREYPQSMENERLANIAAAEAAGNQRQAQKIRNQAADALDETIMEYAAARQARRAYHVWNDELKQRDEVAWQTYNDAKVELVRAAQHGDEKRYRELGPLVAQLKCQREEVCRQTSEAIVSNPKEWQIDNRMRKATEAKTAAQKALDAADAVLEAATKLVQETKNAYEQARGQTRILADKIWLSAEAAYTLAPQPATSATNPQETDKIISH